MYACGQLAMSDDRVDHIPDTLCGWGIGFRALEDDVIEPTFFGYREWYYPEDRYRPIQNKSENE